MERHQVGLYLGALAVGACAGLLIPGLHRPASAAVNPLLALLLYATFLGVPFASIARSLRDWRFLGAVAVVNFAIVPVVVFALSRIVAHDRVLLVGVLFVLLTPCVDYVVVFCGLAGGARDRLLSATPLLMIGQILLLPVFLRAFVEAEFAEVIDPAPFLHAFLYLILLPLVAAALTQFVAAHSRGGRIWERTVSRAMVPLMVLVLAAVVASHIAGVGAHSGSLLLLVPVYVLFAVAMAPIGAVAGRLAGLDGPGRRALLFSGVTRNSLVVLPLVLALPPGFELAPLVVVAQTMVELAVMVLLVRLFARPFIRRIA